MIYFLIKPPVQIFIVLYVRAATYGEMDRKLYYHGLNIREIFHVRAPEPQGGLQFQSMLPFTTYN